MSGPATVYHLHALVRNVIAGGLCRSSHCLCICRRPEVFSAAVLHVPFVDMLTAMMQPALALTAHEYGEWGDVRVDQCALNKVCFTLFPPSIDPRAFTAHVWVHDWHHSD